MITLSFISCHQHSNRLCHQVPPDNWPHLPYCCFSLPGHQSRSLSNSINCLCHHHCTHHHHHHHHLNALNHLTKNYAQFQTLLMFMVTITRSFAKGWAIPMIHLSCKRNRCTNPAYSDYFK